MSPDQILTLVVAALATAGVILRPFRIAEVWFATAGAALLVALGLLSPRAALTAVLKGTDVYLFLAGMMMLAALALREGLFDHLAARAAGAANGSSTRLFLGLYLTGTLVTAFLSNDATAVVLTPAVCVTARHARVDPLPHLFGCAFIANAASFVLPISNPANLVVFGAAMPPLGTWLADLLLPAVAAIVVTYFVLRRAFAADLAAARPHVPEVPPLSRTGQLAAGGIVLAAVALVAASAVGADLGGPTLLCGLAALVGVTLVGGTSPLPLLRQVSWGVLPLVAGLFVLVEGAFRTGLFVPLTGALAHWGTTVPRLAAALAGAGFGTVSNLMNNLPAGLVAATALHQAEAPRRMVEAVAMGIDLGPNLSVTGSLATILWLIVLRREGIEVRAGQFLRIGAVAMPLALGAALMLLLV
ncbi:SLC13 family permease [Solirhodobacter olei]|uniref:SLC13 family permease n=1 Tax=Solirhodobacter olei TaxID=2493082 RepID=UPI000FDB9E64|nr:SLC13 family permease [Solirhodobacter olei]